MLQFLSFRNSIIGSPSLIIPMLRDSFIINAFIAIIEASNDESEVVSFLRVWLHVNKIVSSVGGSFLSNILTRALLFLFSMSNYKVEHGLNILNLISNHLLKLRVIFKKLATTSIRNCFL